MDEKEIHLIHAARTAYRDWLETLDVPAFEAPGTEDASSPAVPAGFTTIALAAQDPNADQRQAKETLKERLGPWLSGYLRDNGQAAEQAAPFLEYILEHLSEMAGRRFRDTLPLWLAAFSGRTVDAAKATITIAFPARQAVARVLSKPATTEEAGWALTLRQHLLHLALPGPTDLLNAEPPEELKHQKFVPAYQRTLYQEALRLYRQGLSDFEFPPTSHAA